MEQTFFEQEALDAETEIKIQLLHLRVGTSVSEGWT